MRGSRVAAVGLLVAAGHACADVPAARLLPPTAVARGQAPAQPPAGGALSQPRPVPQGPTVTEQRANPPAPTPPPATVTPPAAMFGSPVPYGSPVPIGGPMTYLGLPPVAGGPPSVAPTVVTPNIEAPLIGPGSAPAMGPFGLLTGGHGFGGPQRLHLDADFLLWWVRSGNLPALVTTGPVASEGALGRPGTQVVYGDDSRGRTLHTGARFGGTYWLDECNRWGLDGSLFFLARRGFNDTFTSSGEPLLARPFVNANAGTQSSELVAFPGLASGAVVVTGETTVWGAGANVRRHLFGGCEYRVDGLLGFRYLNFSESLGVTEQIAQLPGSQSVLAFTNAAGSPAVGSVVSDRFRTENNFYGVNVGLAGELRRGRWYAEGRASVAFGTVFQTATAEGSQLATFADGTAATYAGGLLALPSNSGSYSQRKFGVVPEAGLKLGCHLTDRWRVNVGYNFLYLNSVLRPGDQIDPVLDITKVPNLLRDGMTVSPLASPRPLPTLRDSGVFVQGISFGLQWAF